MKDHYSNFRKSCNHVINSLIIIHMKVLY